jgi:NNP family nitrate/nitrite transporter-like MFS transporter
MRATRPALRGNVPTVLASALHFDLSFMLWVLIGALGIYLSKGLHLTPSQKGLLVALPVLSGSLLRVPLGLLADHFGGKRVGALMLVFLFLPLAIGWRLGGNLSALMAAGIMLGTAGASFAVVLPLAGRWYPREQQGLVLGITAIGNSGTVLANLFAPRLADHFGWQNVLALAMIPLALVLVVFLLTAKDSPLHVAGQPLRSYFAACGQGDLWWLSLFYSITFGGFVGLSSFLPIFWHDEYRLSPIAAGYLTALAALVGSMVRPLGGYLADRLGGVRVLSAVLPAIFVVYLMAAQSPSLTEMVAVITLGMAFFGMGSGAIFQIVPQHFHRQMGVATGIVGAVGGLGGFFLPTLLGNIKQAQGSSGPSFVILSAVALAAFGLLRLLVTIRAGWRLPAAAVSRLETSSPSEL